MSVAEKRAARERLHTLIEDESNGNARNSMMHAYRLKQQLLAQQHEHQSTISPHCMIRTLDPIIVPPEKKFEHCPGARISLGGSRQTVMNDLYKCIAPDAYLCSSGY